MLHFSIEPSPFIKHLTNKIKDFSLEQTAAGIPSIKSMNSTYKFSAKEIETLRTLALQVKEISNRPIEKEKSLLWSRHNDLEDDTPVVFADPENGRNEIILSSEIVSRDPLARVWEMQLHKIIFWGNEIKDDKVIENYFDVPYVCSDSGWGIDFEKEGGENGGSYIMHSVLSDYNTDFDKLHSPKIIIDEKASNIVIELANEIFSEILNVRRKHVWWWTLGMTWDYINLRGLENLMIDMIDSPNDVHKMMGFLRDTILDKLNFLEANQLLALNTDGTYVGSGGFGFTKQLPSYENRPKHITTMDMWGFAESQETIGVSPDMFSEFVFPYQLEILEKFGLNCYGCCEPIDVRWKYIKQIPRLRRISCSAWANIATMTSQLGKNYILSAKPNPSYLASNKMDEELVRNDIKNILNNSKGAIVEIIMKDNHTLGKNPKNITRWVEIAREEIGRS